MLYRDEWLAEPYNAIMSSFVACLFVEVVATLPSTLATSVTALADIVGVIVDVADSTPTKLPKSASDDFTSGSGEATDTLIRHTSNSQRM